MVGSPGEPTPGALRLVVTGHVQGVGFRPFVYRLAHGLGLTGWVQNQLGQVEIRIEGETNTLREFARMLVEEAPPLARPVLSLEEPVAAEAMADFSIAASVAGAESRIFVPPDYFTCADCLRELEDPADRRHRYPFINCTQCGPRYTLIRAMPYDRPNTTLAGFPLCEACGREYQDPLDRRFHAEPVACAECGPSLSFEGDGRQARCEEALEAGLDVLREGRILAVKGVGGYHLMCDAAAEAAVARLRRRKSRPDKPLAVMFPAAGADGLAAVTGFLQPDEHEARLLSSPVRPIVLVKKLPAGGSVERGPGPALAEAIAPGLGEIGAFLPYSPLHHLLLGGFGAPLVATSGNLSGEPVLTGNREASERLGRIADAFLHHDRPIVRPADDPVFRSSAGRLRPIRLGRGCAPLELSLPCRLPRPVLATGAHMKNTLALAWEDRVVISPHIGEMDTPRSLDVFTQVAADLQALYGVTAGELVSDAHPGYTTTRWAQRSGLEVTPVWHHHAHASALVGEQDDWDRQCLVFAWDGVGLGEDGSLWGGETLLGGPGHWERVASMRVFRLPGGEKAAREPWRSAAALCWETGREYEGGPDGRDMVRQAWSKGLNSPATSAVGRLFDGVSAILLGHTHSGFEGQGPMLLEAVAGGQVDAGEEFPTLRLIRDGEGLRRIDWEPLLPMVLDGSRPVTGRAWSFHRSLARAVAEVALDLREETGVRQVGLCGGVFQNRLLTEMCVTELGAAGFRVRLAERLPCNDAAISYGQVVEYAAQC